MSNSARSICAGQAESLAPFRKALRGSRNINCQRTIINNPGKLAPNCRLQRIQIAANMSGLTSKINSPKVRRGMEKFKRDEIVAVVVLDEASHAANCVLVGLKVGNNELLESDDVR
jgi:hypothetical protein